MKHAVMKALLATMLTSASLGVLAQDAQPETATPPATQQPQAAQIDEATVDKFADAYKSVMSVQQELATELEEADSTEKAQELQMQAQEKMVGAVVDSGLTIEQYNSVVMELEQNPQLAQQVLNKIQ